MLKETILESALTSEIVIKRAYSNCNVPLLATISTIS